MERILSIYGKEVKLEDKSFIKFSARIVNKSSGDVKFYNVKFTKECEMTPKKTGYLKITVNDDKLSVAKGRIYDYENNRREPDTIWVDEVIKIEKDEETEKKVQEEKRKKIEELF